MSQSVKKLALSYFNTIARKFPVMCASDEFTFAPRAMAAARHYSSMESLDAVEIKKTIEFLHDFKDNLQSQNHEKADLDTRIDIAMLRANATGLLIELETDRSWQHNPLLYLKIAMVGIDHAISKPGTKEEKKYRLMSRLEGTTRLLENGTKNIESVPRAYHEAAIKMTGDCLKYVSGFGDFFKNKDGPAKALEKVFLKIKIFRKFLKSVAVDKNPELTRQAFEARLKGHFASKRNPEEIFEIARDEWRENLDLVEKLQKKINPNKSWQEIYHDFLPEQAGADTFALYQQETRLLQNFFKDNGLAIAGKAFPMETAPTPEYLVSVRGSASFAAAFSDDLDEKSFFYITDNLPENKKQDQLLKKRLNREYKFLAAHETIPGHHLLDSVRRTLKNPVRRQIESPLFYEGWAYFAESLVIKSGYIKNEHEKWLLVNCKRRLWRSARCQIETGIPTRIITPMQAVELLENTGFTKKEAIRQIARFGLNPGYQLCYSLGRYEISRLEKIYGPKMGHEAFYEFVLKAGQMPFQWLEKLLDQQESRSAF